VPEKLLFDASSLIYALKLKKLELLHNNYVQWLTIYEVLNGIWKEAHLIKTIKPEEAIAIAKTLRKVVNFMNILSPQGLEDEILKIALKYGITTYDASYIVLAENNNLMLITEDRKLKVVAEKIVETKNLREITK